MSTNAEALGADVVLPVTGETIYLLRQEIARLKYERDKYEAGQSVVAFERNQAVNLARHLWDVIAEMGRDGHVAGDPVPTGHLTSADSCLLGLLIPREGS